MHLNQTNNNVRIRRGRNEFINLQLQTTDWEVSYHLLIFFSLKVSIIGQFVTRLLSRQYTMHAGEYYIF